MSESNKKGYFQRRAGCGWWHDGTGAKGIRDCDGNLLGHRKYLTYRKDDDPEGLSGWVMYEYSAEGLNTTAAIYKIQFKAASAKINNNRRQGDQTQMSANPTPHKKPRVEDKGSHSHDHDQTKGNCDCNDDSDDSDIFAGYLDAMLEKEKENPPCSEDCFGQLVPEAVTNPNEEALGKSQTFDIDWNGLALAVIEPLDNLGSDQFNGGFDHQLMIPTGFEFDDFYTKNNLIFC
ncbi:No apical meristem (NAM) protein [Corchorus olitorius]|uniref:No apical meristem (NAM) protein n=1 Tax=Corchorus olitorius TaxID=93759 RepID=A0A1R3GS49_9ROSI|nr:No apical meristem (NAM) protein [Corchorus olitorius]